MANNTQPATITPIGYPKLAEHFGNNPDFASVRRFGALSARNLLYYQAELLELEKELEDIEERDNTNSLYDVTKDRAASWIWLGGKGNLANREQYDLVLRLRVLLQQYSSYTYPSELKSSAYILCQTKQ